MLLMELESVSGSELFQHVLKYRCQSQLEFLILHLEENIIEETVKLLNAESKSSGFLRLGVSKISNTGF